MNYEVEQKFPVSDLAAVVERLAAMGALVKESKLEVDLYFNHPSRDFAVTDEALRIRQAGPACRITYKGPKIDTATKTRRELELNLDPTEAAGWAEMLQALGFRPVVEVRKNRRKSHVDWQGRQVEVSLDDVAEVGYFVELELIADDQSLAAAKSCLASLANHLSLTTTERRSYLELLLNARKG
jgi:adenylate cyclase class 2